MAVRDVSAGIRAKEAIKAEICGGAEVDVLQLDLSSMASVRRFAAEFGSLNLPLNILMGAAVGSSTGGKGEAACARAWETLQWRRRLFLVAGGAPVTSSSGGERRTTTVGQTNKQSIVEKAPEGPADHAEAVDWLGEA